MAVELYNSILRTLIGLAFRFFHLCHTMRCYHFGISKATAVDRLRHRMLLADTARGHCVARLCIVRERQSGNQSRGREGPEVTVHYNEGKYNEGKRERSFAGRPVSARDLNSTLRYSARYSGIPVGFVRRKRAVIGGWRGGGRGRCDRGGAWKPCVRKS